MAHLGRAYWEREVGLFERAGVSQERFCVERGLKLSTFRTWLYRLRLERATPAAAFVEVVASKQAVIGDACVVRFGVVELAFCRPPDAQYLGKLVRSIAGESL
jgi:hypothetical protein